MSTVTINFVGGIGCATIIYPNGYQRITTDPLELYALGLEELSVDMLTESVERRKRGELPPITAEEIQPATITARHLGGR